MSMDATTPTGRETSIGLTAEQLDVVLPFHLVFDRELRLLQHGRSIPRTCPGLDLGASVPDFLTLSSPRIPFEFDELLAHQSSLVLLRTAGGITLRGQVVPVGLNALSFVGSPWVTDPSLLEHMGLTLSDFALQDSVADYMFLLQAQATALRDAQQLAERLREIDEEKARLAAAEQALAHELNALPDLVFRMDRNGTLLDVRPAHENDLSAPRRELIGGSAYDAFPEMGQQLREALQRSFLFGKTQSFDYQTTRDGADVFYEARVVRCSEREALALVRDVSERLMLQNQLLHQAFHDSLTGLANRALFEDRVGHALARANQHAGQVSVLFIDLDDFKVVNDSLGHRTGDALLNAVAERLQGCTRPGDTVARLGGDEFAVLIEEGGMDLAESLARRFITAFEKPFRINNRDIQIGASIGVAGGTPSSSADDLLRNADMAMYSAKGAGKGARAIFDPAMEDRLLAQLVMESELRAAIQREEFRVLYQPVVDVGTGQVIGTEALVRWQHPIRGLLGPNEFIPLAEQSGLIVPIGAFVLTTACLQAARWATEHPQPLTMSVNVSTRQLIDAQLAEFVSSALAYSGLDPARLVLEVTETALVRDADRAAAVLAELKHLGVRVALDDFGTGYSSLSHLRRFPIDTIKVDKSFIDGIADKEGSSGIARAILEIGRILNVEVVAEGVETEAQRDVLERWHCNSAQGYLWAPPVEATSLAGMLHRQVPRGVRIEPVHDVADDVPSTVPAAQPLQTTK